MPNHPPWLRFQAYVVGLPKTGSTSLATVFGNYRSGHEWELMELVRHALARSRGDLTDKEFLRATGSRLAPPSLEVDSATSHHMYAEVLRDLFPHAVFIHSIRDVSSWVTSLLDMILRKRLARRLVDIPYSLCETEYLADMTERTYNLDPEDNATDQTSLAPLMRYWGVHMRRMAAVLPPGRTLRLRTRDIAARFPEMANLVGVPVETLRADLTHVNKTPLRFDRFTAFDSPELRAVYDEHCADIMAELFPDEHSKWINARVAPENRPIQDWDTYISALREWVAMAVKSSGVSVTR